MESAVGTTTATTPVVPDAPGSFSSSLNDSGIETSVKVTAVPEVSNGKSSGGINSSGEGFASGDEEFEDAKENDDGENHNVVFDLKDDVSGDVKGEKGENGDASKELSLGAVDESFEISRGNSDSGGGVMEEKKAGAEAESAGNANLGQLVDGVGGGGADGDFEQKDTVLKNRDGVNLVVEKGHVQEEMDGEGDSLKVSVPVRGVESGDAGEAAKKGLSLDFKTDGVDSGAVKVADGDLVEVGGGKLTSVGDSAVDAVSVDLPTSGTAVVGNVEESRGSGDGGMDIAAKEGVEVNNQFSQISMDAEKPLILEEKKPVEEKEDEVVDRENSTHGVKSRDASEVAKQSNSMDGKTDGVESGIVESTDGELGEVDGMKLVSEGDSVVEAIDADLSGPGAAVVGKVDESKGSDNGGMHVPSFETVNMDNQFSQIRTDNAVPLPWKDDASVKEKENEVSEVKNSAIGFESRDTGEAVKEGLVVDGTTDGVEAAVVVTPTYGELGEVGGGMQLDSEAKPSEARLDTPTARLETILTPRKDEVKEEVREEEFSTPIAQMKTADVVQSFESEQEKKPKNDISGKSHSLAFTEPNQVLEAEIKPDAEIKEIQHPNEEQKAESSDTEEEAEDMVFGSSEAARQFLEELERNSVDNSGSIQEISHDDSQRLDGQIVADSDEEVDTDEDGDGRELFDSDALTALLKAATGASSEGGSITLTSQDGSRLFSVERPVGLGSPLRSVKPAPRPSRSNFYSSYNTAAGEDPEINLSEEEKKKLEKLQQIKIKFLRLAHRLGLSLEDRMVGEGLLKLNLIGGRPAQPLNLETVTSTALELETEGKDNLDFSLNILVIGKLGVGKSATINSIFGEEKSQIHAFGKGTDAVREIVGTVDGIKIRVVDTPGLRSSVMEQVGNRKILSCIKKYTKKCPPDIVLYVDRLDITQTRNLNDLPLLRTIASSLGPLTLRNAIVTLTHAASAPPDGATGSPLSYEAFVGQRNQYIQQSISQALGDLRLMSSSWMNPLSLVENHSSCRKNRDGQKVLPNGQTWRPQLLLQCYSVKILSEARSLSKPQDPFDHKKLFGFRARSYLPYFLSWLLQSRTHPKLPTDQGIDNGDSDIELADFSDSDQEHEEDEYDQLPSFKPLKRAQLAKLNKEQRRAYFEEYDYRVKLLQKKQWKEELKRLREIKKKGKVDTDEYSYMGGDADTDSGTSATVPVPLPDMALPPSFDGDNPSYRYRFLEPTSQFLARPVLDTHGWDHDCGYDGVNLENSLAIASRFPTAVTVQLTKDKKEFNVHLDSSVSVKHGESGSSMAGFDVQNIGKQLAYTVRGETKFKNLKRNKTTAGVSVTLGENVVKGFKLEDQIALGKRLTLVGSAGTVRSQNDAAYGANLEVRLREADYPIGQDQSSLALSLVKWRGELALGANLQSQFSVGRNSKMAVRAGLNQKLSGQITVRTSSSDQLQIALVGIIPIAMSIYKSIRPGASENDSIY